MSKQQAPVETADNCHEARREVQMENRWSNYAYLGCYIIIHCFGWCYQQRCVIPFAKTVSRFLTSQSTASSELQGYKYAKNDVAWDMHEALIIYGALGKISQWYKYIYRNLIYLVWRRYKNLTVELILWCNESYFYHNISLHSFTFY